MAEPITIPDLENGKIDIDTLADIVNLQEETTVTRLSGPVKTWYGVMQDLAVSGGLAYETLAELQATTGTQGQIAEVTNDGDNTGRYSWQDGAWVKALDTTTSKINQLINKIIYIAESVGLTNTSPDYEYVIAGEDKKLGFALTKSGNFLVNNLEFTGATDSAGDSFRVTDARGQNGLIFDSMGRALFELSPDRLEHFRTLSSVPVLSKRGGLLPDGGVVFMQGSASATADRYLSDISGEMRPYLQRTDIADGSYVYDGRKIRYQLSTGQSLSMGGGAQGMPAGQEVYNSEPPNPQFCLMFDTGVRGVDANDRTAPETATDFVPIKEAYGITQGETQGSGFTSWAHRNDILNGNQLTARVFRAGGRGATSIDLLDKAGGGVVYPHNISDLERAISISQAYGKTVEARSVIWTHGEADRNKPIEEYKSKLIQLATDYRTDFAALLPAENPPVVFITDQLCANNEASPAGNVAIAQLQASNEVDFIYLSTPKYIFKYVDNAHLISPDYAVLGEYNSKVEHYICDMGEDWKPLQPTNIVRNGNKILIDFHVPRGGLVVDNVTVPAAKNLGFEYGDDTGSAEIVEAKVVSSRRVELTLSATPTGANKVVRYAYNRHAEAQPGMSGAWGNIRDQDNTPSFQIPGRRLHNWCVVFNQTIN